MTKRKGYKHGSMQWKNLLLLILGVSQFALLASAKMIPNVGFATRRIIQHHQQHQQQQQQQQQYRIPDSILLDIRGGATAAAKRRKNGSSRSSSSSKSKNKKKSRTATGKPKVGKESEAKNEKKSFNIWNAYSSMLPLTRLHVTLVVLSTVAGLVLGDEQTAAVLSLDPIRLYYGWEVWRPFTAASFLGAPSVSWLMSGYYLFQYGSTLERATGTAQHAIFLLVQITLLTALSSLMGIPFFSNSIITAMLHVLSRAMPHHKVKWLVFTVPYWSLPLGLMASDVLNAQENKLAAAVPHLMGIITGHFYFFHKNVWPKLGGEDWLKAPDFLIRTFDPDAKEKTAKENINSALNKTRNKGKGRKLGGKSRK